jgi:hypothetical protein
LYIRHPLLTLPRTHSRTSTSDTCMYEYICVCVCVCMNVYGQGAAHLAVHTLALQHLCHVAKRLVVYLES